ncbi:sigma 54-interacting transcriptional regulator [Jannaschia aquimarina]|uniref:HTH-type transcriptional regulatory protein TyrR n=1 Tax=Jannaschia aquimarina TaxID=935700 RepID=A0A0D1CQQ8_9RHOB|nr:sigma 54-interacting transcriptional regulator [Jannaschia aquimarina]KIT17112.1 Nitrogen assimilation regulatory protein [Jannaschia aquimarina]SNS47094.1 Transcriptional regulator containing PAS, AAA-type ATPase, and DNA-binding Fis domains [Jannaschia aquimarina]
MSWDILELSDDGHLVLDPQGRVRRVDATAAAMLGLAPGAAVGRAIDGLAPTAEGWAALSRAVGEGVALDAPLRLGPRHVLATLRGPAGGERLVELRDLDALDWRRGGTRPAQAAPARTRPDFEAQRRLSPDLHRVLSRGERAMRAGMRVLIVGESGVGKSEIARFLHASVADASDPFQTVNCALGVDALAGRLFGEDGALAASEGGTLFLDDVAEMPLELQARLIGWLEDGDGRGPAAPPPRVIAATNSDLRAAVAEGGFRADLFWRLAVATLRVPALREMPGLVPHLTQRFLRTINQRRTTPVILPQRLLALLDDYAFPGNIRELLNLVQRAAIFVEDAADMEELLAELMLPADDAPEPEAGATMDLRAEVRRFERNLIDRAVAAHGSKRAAARALGVDIGTIVRKTADKADTTNREAPADGPRNKGETA